MIAYRFGNGKYAWYFKSKSVPLELGNFFLTNILHRNFQHPDEYLSTLEPAPNDFFEEDLTVLANENSARYNCYTQKHINIEYIPESNLFEIVKVHEKTCDDSVTMNIKEFLQWSVQHTMNYPGYSEDDLRDFHLESQNTNGNAQNTTLNEIKLEKLERLISNLDAKISKQNLDEFKQLITCKIKDLEETVHDLDATTLDNEDNLCKINATMSTQKESYDKFSKITLEKMTEFRDTFQLFKADLLKLKNDKIKLEDDFEEFD